MYETWVVDELGEPIFRCSTRTQEGIDVYLENHPECSIRCIPCSGYTDDYYM